MATDLLGPSKTQIKEFILASQIIDFKLLNDETVTGKIIWKDEIATLVEREDGTKITIMNNAIAYYYCK